MLCVLHRHEISLLSTEASSVLCKHFGARSSSKFYLKIRPYLKENTTRLRDNDQLVDDAQGNNRYLFRKSYETQNAGLLNVKTGGANS
jgi:hypothetical protein